MIIQTQTQGIAVYGVEVVAKTVTSIDIKCYITQIKFAFLTSNYLLIHPNLVSDQIIFGV